MKKFICFLIILLIPISVKAGYGIENYRIDINVLNNGNVYIQEAFKMNSIYNGFERKIYYKNNYTSYYGSILSSTGDASIYNGSGISLNEIRGINFDLTSSFEKFIENGDLFTKVDSATKGDYGVYVVKKDHEGNGEEYIIYNPNNMNKDFYLSYTLENMAVVNNDVAELELNLFNEMEESIGNLEIYIHVKDNENLLKVWAHGFSDGDCQIIDNETAKINISNLSSNPTIDFRIIFDKSVLYSSKKYTGINVLNKIIDIENNLSKEANKEKDEEYNNLKNKAYSAVELAESTEKRTDYDKALEIVNKLNTDNFKIELQNRLNNLFIKIEKKEFVFKVVYTIINLAWLIGLIIFLIYIGLKSEKVKKTKNNNFDLPNSYGPAIVGFLMKKKIDNNDLVASILYLIDKKVIKYISLKDKNFKLIKLNCNNQLSESDQKLLKFIFNGQNEVTSEELKKEANENYEFFITSYSNWINTTIMEAESLKFYDESLFLKMFGIIYSIIGILMSIFLIDKDKFFSSNINLVLGLIFLLYFVIFNKKTKIGFEEKYKWLILKKKLKKFNQIKRDNLPETKLWGKYLVYSVSLGCSNKLSKKIYSIINNKSNKDFKEIDQLIKINHSIKNLINDCLKIAYKARNIANSKV